MSSPTASVDASASASESTASDSELASSSSLTKTSPYHPSVVVLSRAGTSRAGARHATVYDAVAGRVKSTHHLLSPKSAKIRQRGYHHGRKTIHPTRSATLSPADVLFRRCGAPPRYAELDIYRQDEHLPKHARLPESDLVKSVHSYAAAAYQGMGRTQWDQPSSSKELKDAGQSHGRLLAKTLARQDSSREPKEVGNHGQRKLNVDLRSMDETALLAFGILLEEAGHHLLGKRGDMVLTEGLGVGEDGEERVVGIEEGDTFWKRKMTKRPRRQNIGDEGEHSFMDVDVDESDEMEYNLQEEGV